MDRVQIAWLAFGIYAIGTALLALRGMRRTTTLSGFALGNGDLGPVVTGITLAAAIASTATFVINPGFVYKSGLSALLHLGVASFGGVIVGLVVFSRGFRQLGEETKALTLPQWVGERFNHGGMRTYFAVLNLILAISFVVLIVKGSSFVMMKTLGIGYTGALLIVVVFVFSYVLMGGTYAHVYTNALQGSLMVVVAILIVGSGLHLFSDGLGPFLDRLAAQDPHLLDAVNSNSSLFNSAWGVFGCGFIVGIGLVAQPHILTKSLYLRSEKDLRKYLIISSIVCIVYASILLAGLYARVEYPDIAKQDMVIPHYLANAFPPIVGVLVSVALMAAGMSTLDGILVSASTIAANDIFLGVLGERLLKNQNAEQRQVSALKASRYIIVALGVVAFLVALNPPKLVGIFAQVGIYGLVSAAIVPIAGGIFFPRLRGTEVFVGAIVGPLVHFAHYGTIVWVQKGVLNPAISATSGILAATFVVAALSYLRRSVGDNELSAAPVDTKLQ